MRRENEVIIGTDGGRDAGKRFKVTEATAMEAEDFIADLLGAMFRGETNVEGIFSGGWEVVAKVGIKALLGLQKSERKPLLDRMMKCVTIMPNPNNAFARDLTENDIEEMSTLLQLQDEVIRMHTGFSIRDALSGSDGKSSKTQEKGNGSSRIISMSHLG
jgi:hypothetical protein